VVGQDFDQPSRARPAMGDRRARTLHPTVGISRVARPADAGPASFDYLARDGSVIDDRAVLERIRRLAIPPAWTDVWISERPAARLQATGRDARGRKQYRYHRDFRAAREQSKFAALVEYGRALPAIRRQVDHDLRRRGLPREKVLATTVAVLEATRIRIGNRKYAEANHSYGLTTLRPQQVEVEGGTVRFVFRGKAGRRHRIALHDRRLATVVARCRAAPGQELFQYVGPDGDWAAIHSQDVNDYLRAISGSEVTAKSIRTWSASVLALRALREGKDSEPASPRSALGQAIRTVADALGNTPPVARASYVHPEVIDWFLRTDAKAGPSRRGSRWLSADERQLLSLLEGARHDDRGGRRRAKWRAGPIAR
jgi:DNA topoisomerase-1